jgi:hypothetical protein
VVYQVTLGPIAHDVSMGGVVTEDKEINRAQYLDLIYSQTTHYITLSLMLLIRLQI